MSVVFNYTKAEYESKIASLEAYVSQLESLLSDFESKKSEITNFWDDAEAYSYQDTINTNIRACKTAIFNTNTTITQLKETVSKMEATKNAVNEAIDEAKVVASALATL